MKKQKTREDAFNWILENFPSTVPRAESSATFWNMRMTSLKKSRSSL